MVPSPADAVHEDIVDAHPEAGLLHRIDFMSNFPDCPLPGAKAHIAAGGWLCSAAVC